MSRVIQPHRGIYRGHDGGSPLDLMEQRHQQWQGIVPGFGPIALGFSVGGKMPSTLWNPADKDANISLSNGGLTATSSASRKTVRSIASKTAGLFYWEVVVSGSAGDTFIGIATSTAALGNYLGSDAQGAGYHYNGTVYDGVANNYAAGGGYDSGATIQIFLNATSRTIWFGKNGSWAGAPGVSGGYSIIPTGPLFAAVTMGANSLTANFGNTPFVYTPPAGATNLS